MNTTGPYWVRPYPEPIWSESLKTYFQAALVYGSGPRPVPVGDFCKLEFAEWVAARCNEGFSSATAPPEPQTIPALGRVTPAMWNNPLFMADIEAAIDRILAGEPDIAPSDNKHFENNKDFSK